MKIETCIPDRLPLSKLDWASLVPLLGEAREALARYDEYIKKITPHQLEILKWKEAIASLESQQVQADLKEVLLFSKNRSASEPRAHFFQKIINAKEGLDFAIRWAHKTPLDTLFFCRVHALVKRDAPNPKEIGKIRIRQNWIGPEGAPFEEAYFYPPQAGKLNKYLDELNQYSRIKDRDPLVQLAILFAQFLILHPFMDGNGRVARIYIPIWLYKRKLISQPALFLSSYFFKHRLSYFRKLFQITQEAAWEEWICYFLKGVIIRSGELKKEILMES